MRPKNFSTRPWRIGALAAAIFWASATTAHARGGKLEVSVVDRATGKPIACRMHLRDSRGRPRKVPGAPFWHDHFVFDGTILLELPRGHYTFEIECGPEYVNRLGRFEIKDSAKDKKTVDMKRFVDMSYEGWWAGDLHVRRDTDDLPLLMRAEDLHVAHVVTWDQKKNAWSRTKLPATPIVEFDGNRCYHRLAGADARAGGSMLLLNLAKPIDLTAAGPEFPPAIDGATQAQKDGAWRDAEKAFSWDLPVWVAAGAIDSVQIANQHLGRSAMVTRETGGKPRNRLRMPDPYGNGMWSQQIYFHLLNCGLRLPPTAGSGSGITPNPVGYNRVYVYCGEDFSYKTWMAGLAAGRVVVTNGPLMRPTVEGYHPGHVFTAEKGESLELEIGLNLATRETIDYLEVIQNGEVVHEVRLSDWAENKGRLPKLQFTASGWFLVRGVTDAEKTYRYAMTGPYYVQIGDANRVSKRSAQFFLDWTNERARALKIDDPRHRAAVLKYHDHARGYFGRLVDQANAP